ncbi:hypothetical protein JCM15754A_17380 [Prevotella aurantiaca JCM 15754]|jgi:hypothetical protein
MKKLLFLTLAFVLSLSTQAQRVVLQRGLNNARNVKSIVSYKSPSYKIDPKSNQVWWGYESEKTERSSLGTKREETYNLAIRIDPGNADIVGKTIKAIRFYLRDNKNTNNVKVWISKTLPSDVNSADYVQNADQASLNDDEDNKIGAVNDIELTNPYTISADGAYIGYSFTISSAVGSQTRYPIVTWGGDSKANSFYIRTSETITEWTDLSNDYGKVAMQILVEGNFAQNSVTPVSTQDIVLVKNTIGKNKLVITNSGQNSISSIDYTVATDGTVGAEQHLDINPPFKTYGGQFTIDLPLAADANTGTTTKTITITKVNGQANESKEKTITCKMLTVGKLVNRGVVVEEFTGTGCPWCPRGWAGMKKLRDKFGEKFVGIGIHQYNDSDPMYCKNYAKLKFDGAPQSMIERGNAMDPFYGAGKDDICIDFKEVLERVSTIGVTVSGKYNADFTEVTATATIEPLISGTYEIAYVLIGDELKGTESSWKQSNNYVSFGPDRVDNDPYLVPFCKGGEYGSSKVSLTFDDVLLASSYSSATNQAKLEELQEGKVVTNTYTLKLPTKEILKKAIVNAGYNKLAVIAMIIRNDGKIENAAKFYLSNDPAGIEGVSENKSELKEVARYTIDGRRISTQQRGLNIVKMSDGSTVKVLVK